MSISFENTYVKLPERFYAKQAPAQVPDPELILLNRQLAAQLSIDPDWLASSEGIAILAGNSVPEGAQPISQAYAGHQFGGFVPQLGDGRAILLGEVMGANGQRYDLQLKGSGRTPFSRNGDGKSALGPVIREYILSEAMAALGVPTTRALAAVSTGETVRREEGAMAGGIFTRVAASHIRVGTFQYYHSRNDVDALKLLAEHVIARHFPAAQGTDHPYLTLLDSVVSAQASLIAHWMSLGFIHGVMNTDNMTVSGETIDYGPCAFMEAFHPQCVFSSIDQGARYAWGNQPEIGLWNLTRLAETLLPLVSEDSDQAIEQAESVLSNYAERFGDAYSKRLRAKLGLSPDVPFEIITDCLNLLAEQKIDFTLFFRKLTQVANGEDQAILAGLFTDTTALDEWLLQWRHATDASPDMVAMQAANPILIPRNHRVEQAIQSAYRGDYAPFKRLVDALAAPYEEQPEYVDLEKQPEPDEVVHRTFCGT